MFAGQLQEAADRVIDKGDIGNQMIIVEDQDEVLIDLGIDFIGDRDEQSFFVLFDGRHTLQRRQGILPKTGELFGNRGNQIPQEPLRVLIERVEGKPANREFALLSKIHQQ